MNDGHGLNESMWLKMLRRYLAFVVLANLAWEVAHLPLYTIWQTASRSKLAFAVLHCTLGDLVIATMSFVLAVLLVGDARWPRAGYVRVAVLTTCVGVAYTVFSEWINLVVRASWAYAPAMPIVPLLGVGLSPLLQWIVIPPLGLWIARNDAPTH